MSEHMPEDGRIKQFGSSVGVALSRTILKNVYGLVVDSPVEIDYSSPPNIIIRPKKKEI